MVVGIRFWKPHWCPTAIGYQTWGQVILISQLPSVWFIRTADTVSRLCVFCCMIVHCCYIANTCDVISDLYRSSLFLWRKMAHEHHNHVMSSSSTTHPPAEHSMDHGSGDHASGDHGGMMMVSECLVCTCAECNIYINDVLETAGFVQVYTEWCKKTSSECKFCEMRVSKTESLKMQRLSYHCHISL